MQNASIVARNTSTNVVTQTRSNTSGIYTFSNLLPGSYQLRVTAPTFDTTVISKLVLTVGATATVNVSLVVGSINQVVEVTSDNTTVDLSQSALVANIGQRTIRDLPLNARDWTQLATLQPGVSAIHTQVALGSGPDRGNRGFGSQLSIGGTRPEQNNYRLDGISINDYSNGAPGSVLGVNLGVDAVQEFSVVSGTYSAAYGLTSGGVINASTKSGSNKFHGDGYEFYRNSAMDARNYFDPPQKAPFLKNQFGASAGGPIIKNKTFIFGDFEGLHASTTQTSLITVPSDAARAGNLVAGNVTVDPYAAKILSFYPHADAGTVQGDTGTTIASSKVATSENYFTIRVDHTLTSKDSLVGTYVFDRGSQTQPDSLQDLVSGNSTHRQIANVADTHIFSNSFLDTVHFGYNKVLALSGQNVSAINPLATDTSLGALPGKTAPDINFGDNNLEFPGGLGAQSNYIFDWKTFQFYDDAFLTRGINSLSFGFAFEHILDNITANSDANGVLQYNNFHDFITNGSAASFEAPNGGVITPRNLRQSVIGGYIQDDIRASKRLMLNIGLRYEIATVLSETSGRLSALRNLTDTTPHLGSPFFANPTLRNFDPRVGFSYNPDGHGATAIRGGVGIYDVLPLPYVFTLLAPLSAPFFKAETASNTPAGSAPSGLAALLSASGKLRQAYVTPAPKRNYVVQWNFNVQRTLTKNTSLMLAYIGSRSIHLAFRDEDANFVQPFDPQSRTPTFPGRDVNGNPLGTQINPNVGQISSVFFTGDAYYDALEAKLTENLSHGLQGGISYTYGKSIDTGSGTIGGDKFSNSIASMFPYNSRIRRGPSDFDQRHNLVANLLWYIPGPHGSNGFAKAIAGGWQVTGEYQISTGIPFTPNISGDPLGLVGHHAFDFPDRSNASGCSSLVNPGNVNHYIKTSCLSVPNPINKLGDLSRNALTGPGLQNLDMAFIKNNPVHRISDAFNVQLRFETYNLANHANFGPPVDNLDVFDGTGAPVASGGQIDSTSTTSRQIQLGVKVIW